MTEIHGGPSPERAALTAQVDTTQTGAAVGHGHARRGKVSPEYSAWRSMICRCTLPTCERFPHYGGKGIEVCARWLGRGGFANFLADLGPRPGPGYSLERDRAEVDYCPENCRWATDPEQRRNKTTTRYVTLDGQQMPLVDAVAVRGLKYHVVKTRLLRGWPEWRALECPPPAGYQPSHRPAAS